ncbi:MAG TPA: lysylphosphatidylglycerol synthase domain-containing protein [Steroidobacteraceae bacterium]|nr:lysylphosphatidylglycerol synthase domain-containing protein [Steroidobacteraceae bacterium]
MSRAAPWLLAAGALLFVLVLASHDLRAILATLALAGWGLLGVTAFHLVPLVLDAAAIRVVEAQARRGALLDAVRVRWIGESANSLMPAGQIGGPLLMMRQLIQRGTAPTDAVSAITVSTTMQSFAQVVFALMGMGVMATRLATGATEASWTAVLIACACLVLPLVAFYLLQRRGLFARVMRLGQRFAGARDWSHLVKHAQDIDAALEAAYRRPGPLWQCFALNLAGWIAGTVETWLILHLLGSSVSWSAALMLESLGQAIRGAAFAIPGALGVQEGGYLLLGPLAGVRPDVALALSLGKRARELLLGIPGLAYLYLAERAHRRRVAAAPLGG